jgi:hypothetical protein
MLDDLIFRRKHWDEEGQCFGSHPRLLYPFGAYVLKERGAF